MTSTASDPSLPLLSVCLQEKNGLSSVPYLCVCGNAGHDQQAPQSSFFFKCQNKKKIWLVRLFPLIAPLNAFNIRARANMYVYEYHFGNYCQK